MSDTLDDTKHEADNISLYGALEKALTFAFIEGCKCVSQMQSKHVPHLHILIVYQLYFSCLSMVKC